MTKSSSRHGGRRKGAGRPRFTKTGKTEFFTTRITPKTRSLLEAEAKRCGESLSVVAEGMLLGALEKRGEARIRSRQLRALFFLIEKLAAMIRGEYGRGPPDKKLGRDDPRYKYSWFTDPYMFESFELGIMNILGVLRPAGDVVKPPGDPLFVKSPTKPGDPIQEQHSFPDTPGEWASRCASSLYFYVRHAEEMEARGESISPSARTHYGLIDAGRDLNLDIRGKQK